MNTLNFSRLTLGVLALTLIGQSVQANCLALNAGRVVVGEVIIPAAEIVVPQVTRLAKYVPAAFVGAGVAAGSALTTAASYFNPTAAPVASQGFLSKVGNGLVSGVKGHPYVAGATVAAIAGGVGYKLYKRPSVKVTKLKKQVEQKQQELNAAKEAFKTEITTFANNCAKSSSYDQKAADALMAKAKALGTQELVNGINNLVSLQKARSETDRPGHKAYGLDQINKQLPKIIKLVK